jgi:hypothetical protein
MEISPQISLRIKPDLYQSVLKTRLFSPGSILTLKVLELRGDRALIDFGAFRASADVKIPVTRGEELRVIVQESGTQLKLALLNPDRPKISTGDSFPQQWQSIGSKYKIQTELKHILNQILTSQAAKTISKPILDVLTAINTHYEGLDLEKIAGNLMPRVKSYLQNSGFLFEKRLESTILKSMDESHTALPKQLTGHPEVQAIVSRDLKANLLALNKMAEEETALQKTIDGRTLAALRKAADLLLTDIVDQQGRAVRHRDSAEPFQVFTYVLPLAEEKLGAKLKIYYQKKQKAGSKKGFLISLLLSMDRLGEIRTDFYQTDKDLSITFYVKEPSIEPKINRKFKHLTDILTPLFDQISLRVIVSEKKIMDFDHEDGQIASDKRIDLKV